MQWTTLMLSVQNYMHLLLGCRPHSISVTICFYKSVCPTNVEAISLRFIPHKNSSKAPRARCIDKHSKFIITVLLPLYCEKIVPILLNTAYCFKWFVSLMRCNGDLAPLVTNDKRLTRQAQTRRPNSDCICFSVTFWTAWKLPNKPINS